MAYEYDVKNESFVAGADLSALMHRVVDLSGGNSVIDVAGAGGGYGVLQNKPRLGEHATVAAGGISLVRVGAAVNAGSLATSAASGWAVQVSVTTGTVSKAFGIFMTSAASGMLASVKIDRTFLAAFV